MKQTTLTVSASHEKIISLLKEHGRNDFRGGIQLFANQYDKEYGISVNYCSTGIHIGKEEVDERELLEDELIKVCKSWTFVEK